MSKSNEIYCDYPNMDKSQVRYSPSHISSKKEKVYCMCKPISAIRGKNAEELLELCGQQNRIPVDLKSLLKKLKISCVSYDFSKLESAREDVDNSSDENPILGALAINGDNAVIFYRKEDKKEGHRYRFTIAHELAHVCLEHYPIENNTVHLAFRHEHNMNDIQEIDANIFAGELLIPKQSLEEIIENLFFPSLQALAEIFAVSINVMRARLDYLKMTVNISGYNC